MKNILEATSVMALIIGFICMMVFMPAITFGFAYFGGWILKLCVGDMVANGMNLIFNTTRFTADIIPITCATLATVGKYFKSIQTNNNKKS